jgi:hypothetical protein
MFKFVSSTSTLCLLIVISTSSALAAASLSLTPASVNLKAGDTITLTTTINPNGARVGAAEINYTFDPSLLSFIAFTPGVYSTCVPGADTAGSIARNCAVLGGTTQVGSFGTISLKALKNGEARVTVGGQVLDENNSNILAGSVSGLYKIGIQAQVTAKPTTGVVKSASVSASPTKVPTMQPTITVSFGTVDEPTPTPTPQVQGFSSANVALGALAALVLAYFVYSKRIVSSIKDKFKKD